VWGDLGGTRAMRGEEKAEEKCRFVRANSLQLGARVRRRVC
jgi:hypothetical protein